jgi:hypothetical protein
MALDSCALHLETGGVYLVAALLDRKNLPVPIPLDRVSELIRSCVKSLAPSDKKYIKSLSLFISDFNHFSFLNQRWKSETGRIHLQGLIRMLSSATG